MKRVRCPKCGHSITFDETHYSEGNTLIFECEECRKQFGVRIGSSQVLKTRKEERAKTQEHPSTPADNQEALSTSQTHKLTDEASEQFPYGYVTVVENVFHYRQTIALQMGQNVFGRYVRGSSINAPIETVDPSVDTTHCIINVERNRKGALVYTLRDAPSGTGTFVQNTILRDNDRLRLDDGTIITIGATTLIFHAAGCEEEETTAESR
ncbi:MAG: FHA domain-containing protein [Bacteroidaceae bacterium]|nr:FHA domain-containing protein [Bacteroidaceae bacterium]